LHFIVIVLIDWLIDRFRTAINVLGDAFGAGIVNHLSQGDLQNLSLEEEPTSPNGLTKSHTRIVA